MENCFDFLYECPLQGATKHAKLMMNLLHAISKPHTLIGFWGLFLIHMDSFGSATQQGSYFQQQPVTVFLFSVWTFMEDCEM
jgi:hypothetical protein